MGVLTTKFSPLYLSQNKDRHKIWNLWQRIVQNYEPISHSDLHWRGDYVLANSRREAPLSEKDDQHEIWCLSHKITQNQREIINLCALNPTSILEAGADCQTWNIAKTGFLGFIQKSFQIRNAENESSQVLVLK